MKTKLAKCYTIFVLLSIYSKNFVVATEPDPIKPVDSKGGSVSDSNNGDISKNSNSSIIPDNNSEVYVPSVGDNGNESTTSGKAASSKTSKYPPPTLIPVPKDKTIFGDPSNISIPDDVENESWWYQSHWLIISGIITLIVSALAGGIYAFFSLRNSDNMKMGKENSVSL